MKLTKTSVANLTYTGKPTLYFDDEINGFAVRVGSTCKSYQLLYRNKFHVQKVYTIAKTNQCSVQDARETAKKLLAQVIMGEDPQTESWQTERLKTSISLFKCIWIMPSII